MCSQRQFTPAKHTPLQENTFANINKTSPDAVASRGDPSNWVRLQKEKLN
jgi:hypothetical protein